MSRARTVTRNEMDLVVRELKSLQRRLGRVENQHSPTVPIYDPDFPDDAVDGQFALASNPPEDLEELSTALPYFFFKKWHPLIPQSLASGMPFITLRIHQEIEDLSDTEGLAGEVDFSSGGGTFVTNDHLPGGENVGLQRGFLGAPFTFETFSYDIDTPNRIFAPAGIYLAGASVQFTDIDTGSGSMDIALELSGGGGGLGALINTAEYTVVDFSRIAFSPAAQLLECVLGFDGTSIGIGAGCHGAGGSPFAYVDLGIVRLGPLGFLEGA